MFESGCYTDLVTPFKESDQRVDWRGLRKNIDFQIKEGVQGIIVLGLAGESSTVSPGEHGMLLKKSTAHVSGRACIIGGAGSNSLKEALVYTGKAQEAGCEGVLLVEPYFNLPSSIQMRDEYYREVAKKFPRMKIIPCSFPSRTGSFLTPQDLKVLDKEVPGVCGTIREVRGNYDDLSEVRKVCRPDFAIFSAQDERTYKMMVNSSVKAQGVFSVIGNIAPGAVQKMVEHMLHGKFKDARKINNALKPLYEVVIVKEPVMVEQKVIVNFFPIPVSIKIMMKGLGLPSGNCRSPLRKTPLGAKNKVREALRRVWQENRWVLEPLESFYEIDIRERLEKDEVWQ